MVDDNPFARLIGRIRNGDEDAVRELIEEYGTELRIVARSRLTDRRVRRIYDSMDVCQSVLGNFFVRVAAGQFDINSPSDLINLLTTMIRNKVYDRLKHNKAEKHGCGRSEVSVDGVDVAGGIKDPLEAMANAELLENVLTRLSDVERKIAELRSQNATWEEVAESIGGSPDGIRKAFVRKVNRLMKDVGLDTHSYE